MNEKTQIPDERDIKIRNFELVSDALRAQSVENEYINEFTNLITDDFVKLCSIEKGVNDAVPLQKLQYIQKEMQLIANCAALHSKTIGAIGGGFSSGKSAFINSFIDKAVICLAEGIRPVTAIPSYVVSADKPKISGVTFRGGRFDISLDMYKAISHKLLKSFSFNLKEIILYTMVLAPMNPDLFGHLCLIDTPGYNPSTSGTSKTDFETAREYIKDANFLIWLVKITEGTMPKSDLDFFSKLEFGQIPEKPLYIVATNAASRSLDTVEEVLDEIADVLDDHDIQYAGISAYDSKEKKLYARRKMDVFQFLQNHNKPSQKYIELKGILHGVFKDYVGEIHQSHEEKEIKRQEVKTLLGHALASGSIELDDASNKLEEGLNNLVHYFHTKEDLSVRLQRVRDIRDKFLNCLDRFCDDAGVDRTVLPYCTNCGALLKPGEKVCSQCSGSPGETEKICPKCGKKLPAKAVFCTECGTRL
jgi:ribosomal protein L40E